MMPDKKIDELRNLIAAIGKQQHKYYELFPDFTDELVVGLGQYMGDEKSVALTTNKGTFNFDIKYRHEGLGFEGGRFRVPIMIKFDNLNDDGRVWMRIRLFFTINDNSLSISINNGFPIEIQKDRLEPLYDHIYHYLCECFSEENWFAKNTADYQSTGIGFLAN